MADDDKTQHDARKRRCPMLGHDLTFEYCRRSGGQIPCRRIFDCWWETFDVEGWVRGNYTEEQVAALLAPKQDKAVTLFELIRKAQQRNEE
jgi:hypothetical protein